MSNQTFKTILLVFGTRPEAIKMAPLVNELKLNKSFKTLVCVTAQHREMLDQVLSIFDIKPDFDLNIMKHGQDLYDVSSSILIKLRDVYKEVNPDLVMVHGDTATTFTAAQAAFYQQIPVAHVEAGLRTGNLYSPWPEEGNRLLTSKITNIHLAPTITNKNNLLSEGINEDDIHITGNTVIDAMLLMLEKINSSDELQKTVLGDIINSGYTMSDKKIVLITGHRRENFGQGFLDICEAIKNLAITHPDVDFVYPLHLNPNVREPVNNLLSNLSNVFLIEPLDYMPFLHLLNNSYLVLTDSGGIQEEAPTLGKPVVVMRDTTERPEAVDAGTVVLAGTAPITIFNEVNNLLSKQEHYASMSQSHNPYGDGDACKNIIKILTNYKDKK